MKTATHPGAATLAHWEKHGTAARPAGQVPEQIETGGQTARAPPADFVPLAQEDRTHVSTAVMCRHLNRKEQTARGWASSETYPEGLRPLRVMGRFAWPVAGIRRILGMPA